MVAAWIRARQVWVLPSHPATDMQGKLGGFTNESTSESKAKQGGCKFGIEIGKIGKLREVDRTKSPG